MLREAQKDTEKRQSPHAATPEHHKNLLTPSRNPLATLRPPWSLLPSRSHSTPPQGYRVANNSSMPVPARMPRPGRDLDPGPRSPGPCAAHGPRLLFRIPAWVLAGGTRGNSELQFRGRLFFFFASMLAPAPSQARIEQLLTQKLCKSYRKAIEKLSKSYVKAMQKLSRSRRRYPPTWLSNLKAMFF